MRLIRLLLPLLFVIGLFESALAGPLERLLLAQQARLVVVCVDVSGSIPPDDLELYRKSYHSLVSTLQPGDRFVVCKISEQTLTMFRPVIDSEIPNKGSTHAKKVLTERVKEELRAAFDSIQPDQRATETRILDAFNVAQQVFEADKNRKERWLVLLSDMLEDSDEARFEKRKLTPAVVKKIIESRKTRGLLPDLRGVRVYVAGARAPTSSKFSEAQTFWQEYVKETGAIMQRGHYVRDGLYFDR